MSASAPVDTTDSLEKAGFVLLGWLLATLSPVIADAIRRRRRRAYARVVILAELAELKYRLAIVAYYCEMRFGNPDRMFLNWLKPLVDGYAGPMAAATITQRIDILLGLNDAQLAAHIRDERADPSMGGLSLKKYPVPLLASRLADVESLPEAVQPLLLEIHTQLGILDEEAANAQFYFRLTFDSSIKEGNRDRVESNLTQAYYQYASVARVIIKRIVELESAWR